MGDGPFLMVMEMYLKRGHMKMDSGLVLGTCNLQISQNGKNWRSMSSNYGQRILQGETGGEVEQLRGTSATIPRFRGMTGLLSSMSAIRPVE